MDNIFDIAPFPYVGNNKHYRELSKDELDKLKVESVKENPTSAEVEENAIVNMLPQVGLTTEDDEPNVEDILADVEEAEKENLFENEEIDDMYFDDEFDLLKESLDDEVNGADVYFESSKFIETLKSKFKKNKENDPKKIAYNKIMKAAKAYTDLKFVDARRKIAITKDSSLRDSIEFKKYQKKAIHAEKDFRKLKASLTPEEVKILNQYIEDFNSNFANKIELQVKDIEDAKKAAIKKEYAEYIDDVEVLDFLTESVDDRIYTEGANWDLHKRYRADLKTFRVHMRDAGKYIAQHEYDNARSEIKKGIELITKCKEEALAEIAKIDDSKLGTTICGWMLRGATMWCRDILLALIPVIRSVVYIRELVDNVMDIVRIVKKYKEKGYFVVKDFNLYVNFVEKDYDRMIGVLNTFLSKIDNLEKDYNEKEKAKEEDVTKESCETEGCDSEIVTERDIDPGMKSIIDKLHSKGYKTKASSSGHKNVSIKKDGDKDNVAEDHHYGDARLVFDGKYNLGKAPKYWYWKKAINNPDEVDYLDIEQIKKDEWPDNGNKFAAWKDGYMKSLNDWVDGLPSVSGDKKEVEEACCKESAEDLDDQIDTLYESVIGSLMLDILDI